MFGVRGGVRSAFVAALACIVFTSCQSAARAFDPTIQYGYNGPVRHIFFHSLVVYPDKAFRSGYRAPGFKSYMVTRDQFVKILDALHKRNYVLIDAHTLYEVHADGRISPKQLLLPAGKSPLIISLDDLSYYPYMDGQGFAKRLVLDRDGRVATEVVNEQGVSEVTRTGDVVPILDDFIARHPDFSPHGAKGVIALTGYAGVLGYRTQASNTSDRAGEQTAAAKVIAALKASRWQFASHTFTHSMTFKLNTVSAAAVQWDADRWRAEVEPLVGPTDIFVGPFGQMFRHGDPRREVLRRAGFRLFCGVGMLPLLNYYPTEVEMDRANIDGYRIENTPRLLDPYFDAAEIALPPAISAKPTVALVAPRFVPTRWLPRPRFYATRFTPARRARVWRGAWR